MNIENREEGGHPPPFCWVKIASVSCDFYVWMEAINSALVIVPLRLSLWYNNDGYDFANGSVIVPLRLSLWYNERWPDWVASAVIVPLRLSLWYNNRLLRMLNVSVIVPLRLSLWYNTYPKKPAISRIAGFFAFKKIRMCLCNRGNHFRFLKKCQLCGCHFLFLGCWFPEKQLHFCVLLFRENAELTRDFHPRVEGRSRCPWNFSIRLAVWKRVSPLFMIAVLTLLCHPLLSRKSNIAARTKRRWQSGRQSKSSRRRSE